MKARRSAHKYFIMKSYGHGLDWKHVRSTDDLGEALADYKRRVADEPDFDFLILTTIESSVKDLG